MTLPTRAGVVTRDEAFSKLLHHLGEAESCAYILGHLNRDDFPITAQGWRAIGEMMKVLQHKVTDLAMKKTYDR